MVVCRSASLDHVTKLLRQQLDHAASTNQSLSAEVAKLRAQRADLETREADFKREEQVQRSRLSHQTDKMYLFYYCKV